MHVKNPYVLGSYAITANALCVLSYLNEHDVVLPGHIAEEVKKAYHRVYDPNKYDPQNQLKNLPQTIFETTVVWGPAYSPLSGKDTDSLMYIAQVTGTGEYFVVIRGTNPDSLISWLKEDFDVDAIEPISLLPGWPQHITPGDNCTISQGAFNGVSDLLGLVDPKTNTTAVEFLKSVMNNNTFVYVTGHSLGGTLTPVMFAYLNAALYGGESSCNMAMWSFAGLTAGGTGFNNYINKYTPTETPVNWRIYNTFDIAPHLFSAYTGTLPLPLQNLYMDLPDGISIPIDPVAKFLLTILFTEANATTSKDNHIPPGIGFYAQPFGYNWGLSALFENLGHAPGTINWAHEAFYQHHSATYYQMVYLYCTTE